jgi:hypothetical protein
MEDCQDTVEIPSVTHVAGEYSGETVFLLAPGPSLQYVDFDQLDNKTTFAFNHAHFLYDQTAWRPTFFLQNHDVRRREIREGLKKSLEADAICFINSQKSAGELPTELKGQIYDIKTRGNRRPESMSDAARVAARYWNVDRPEDGFYSFASSLGLTAQLCGALGFDEIVLMGADLYRPFPIKTRLIQNGDDPGTWRIRINQEHPFDISPLIKHISQSQAPIASSVNLLYYMLLYKILDILPTRDLNHLHPEYSNNSGLDYQSRNQLYRLEYAAVQEGCNQSGIDLWDASLINRLDMIPRYDSKWELYNC